MAQSRSGKKPLVFILIGVIIVLLVAGAIWLKGYYDERYALDENYYTVVPLDYKISTYDALDSEGNVRGLKSTYLLTGYSADGIKKELEFDVLVDMHELYPPGTFIKVSVSKQGVIGKEALAESDVPATARAKLSESFSPSTAPTLEAYAQERTSQLSAQNTPSLNVTCEERESVLVYTYTYNKGARELAAKDAAYLEPVYRAQFRTDQGVLPELSAIMLEVKLDDGTVLYFKSFDQRIAFGYELN
ncbi:MAG: YxeA family protein [Coriobacteriales bacterium]|jgi:uncharacterized protein (TIGR01655 family)|nr:YxeA family protein [Coriobacteriales bacterium]